jgi:hypothetical protein
MGTRCSIATSGSWRRSSLDAWPVCSVREKRGSRMIVLVGRIGNPPCTGRLWVVLSASSSPRPGPGRSLPASLPNIHRCLAGSFIHTTILFANDLRLFRAPACQPAKHARCREGRRWRPHWSGHCTPVRVPLCQLFDPWWHTPSHCFISTYLGLCHCATGYPHGAAWDKRTPGDITPRSGHSNNTTRRNRTPTATNGTTTANPASDRRPGTISG